jgi:hypothetical protein
MEINDFVAITVVGAGLSLAIDWLKAKFGTEGWATKTVTLLLSILIAGLYVWLRQTSYWQTVLTVLGAASAIYAFFLKKS